SHRKPKRKENLQSSVKMNLNQSLLLVLIPSRIWVPVSLLPTTLKRSSRNLKKPHPLQSKKKNQEKAPNLVQVKLSHLRKKQLKKRQLRNQQKRRPRNRRRKNRRRNRLKKVLQAEALMS